jgi:hypothetical protein
MSDFDKLRTAPRVRRVTHRIATVQGYPSSRYEVTLHDGWCFPDGGNVREFRYTADALAAVRAATPVIPS